MFNIGAFITFLTDVIIPDEPGFIVGPISWVLGIILNFVFNLVYIFTENLSLGITIIVVTIIARFLMLPLAFKQQKSMVVMRKIQPEIKKIQDKYKDDMADPEVKRKMNTEMQKLYSKHNYNPLSGCLPLIIQLPIFIALYYIMQNSYAFIDTINDSYSEISSVVIQNVADDREEDLKIIEQMDNVTVIKQKGEDERTAEENKTIEEYDRKYGNIDALRQKFPALREDDLNKMTEDEKNSLTNYYKEHKYIFWARDFYRNELYKMIPEDMKNPEPDSDVEEFDISKPEHMAKAFDKFSLDKWGRIKNVFEDEKINQNLEKKENIEDFGIGINLTEIAGFGFPGIVITLLSGITTFLSSWLMMRKNKNMGGAAQSQQKIMMITMPLIMAWITSTLPCGVGLYWITSNVFMIVQQQALNKYYENKLELEASKSKNVIEEVPEKRNRKSKR